MKALLTLAIVFLTTGIFAQNVTIENGLYCKKGKTYTGAITLTNSKGIKQSILSVVDGKLQGNAVYFYESGQIMETGSFVEGQRNGKWDRLDENGCKIGEGEYFNGQKHGKWTIWDENGNKRFELSYVHGEKSSTWYNWDENGTVIASANYEKM
ncbi:MAG: hypothetical protein Q8M29_18450 [Bacteroidota bacterium]|nr:hypothetical protein [Bacteroidota bacterium]